MSSKHYCNRCVSPLTRIEGLKYKRRCSPLLSGGRVGFKRQCRCRAVLNARHRGIQATTYCAEQARLPSSQISSYRSVAASDTKESVVLPDELLLKILSKLRFHTLIECKYVSIIFNTIASDSSLYKRLPYKVWNDSLSNLSIEKVLQILKLYPKLEAWTFSSHHQPTGSTLKELSHTLPNLKRIDVTDVEEYQHLDLLGCWPKLESVIAPEYFSNDLTHLKVLEIVEGRNDLPAIKSNSLERICAGQTTCVQKLLDGCPGLRYLRLHWQILNQELHSTTLQNLAVFCIESPTALNDCTNLERLEVTEINETNMASSTAHTLRIWNGNVPCFLLDKFPSVTNLECNYPISTLSEGFASGNLLRLELAEKLPRMYSLPNVSEMILQRVPVTTGIRLAGLRTLNIRCFADKAVLVSTLLQCPLLKTVHLQCTVPWLDSGDIRASSSESVWKEFSRLDFRSVCMVVGDELRGTMPPSFDELLSEHRAGFATPSENLMFS
ncbi:hypothetical protein SARC_10378 [Sphaeroforma arctica JP610]|uniref:F-box domain-containing protein n=1 Tax=Sphaeroforma arctica JP610 TaxID=667725 RepID=A0A0L0FK57_9EUKA|nr:hypothetical protein SARC_10378 [Sphaeroforma arctica JP610]KNC77154.1 hypothetical protein SARC_10378 [Sphaeroforma arctica JP610]|eukprot:XP_014151056.1 hypothetical protein SARC_10378 [Sphaeroforma arctica JP610]